MCESVQLWAGVCITRFLQLLCWLFLLPLNVHISRDLPDLPFTPSYSVLSSLLELSLQSEPCSFPDTSLGCPPGTAPQQIPKERDCLSFHSAPFLCLHLGEWSHCSSDAQAGNLGVDLVPAPSSYFTHTSPQSTSSCSLSHAVFRSPAPPSFRGNVLASNFSPSNLFSRKSYLITCPSSAEKPLWLPIAFTMKPKCLSRLSLYYMLFTSRPLHVVFHLQVMPFHALSS